MTRPPSTPSSGPPIWTPAPPTLLPVGGVIDWPGHLRRIPALWLETYGQSLLRSTFDALFTALVYPLGTATVTAASPGVFSVGSHGLVVGDAVYLEGISTVTGLTADLTYYVMTVPTSGTFTLGTTRTIAAGTGVATVTTQVNTGGGAGLAGVFHAPYGVADSTHFNVPDYRGRSGIGMDIMGGSDGGIIPWSNVPGLPAGESTHQLAAAESGLPDHAHNNPSTGQFITVYNGVNQDHIFQNTAGATWGTNASTTGTVNGGAQAAASGHNTIQPSLAVRKIIYAGSSA